MTYEEFIKVMMTNIGKIDRYLELRGKFGGFMTTNELVLCALRSN